MEKRCSRRSFLRKIPALALAAALPALVGCKEEELKFPERIYSGGPKKYLILDSGHGGETTGTVYSGHQMSKLIGNDTDYNEFKNSIGGVVKGSCEDEVVYDVLCRVLKRDGGEEKVIPVIWDEKTGYEPINNLLLSRPNDEEYLVFGREKTRITDGKQGINERVKVINKFYNLLRSTGVSDDDLYLVSIHADEAPKGRTGAFPIYPVARADYGGGSANQKPRTLEERLRECFKRQGIKTRVGYEEGDYGNGKGIFKSLPQQKVILEIGNMSDLEDYTKLNRKNYREQIAEAIYTLIL